MNNPSGNRPAESEMESVGKVQPEADLMFRQLVEDICEGCEFARDLRTQMLERTGTRLIDWVDHIAVGKETKLNDLSFDIQLLEFGFELDAQDELGDWYIHRGGLFAPICLTVGLPRRLVISIDAVDDFLVAHRKLDTAIEGDKHSQFRRALVAVDDPADPDIEIWVCERHGFTDWSLPSPNDDLRIKALDYFESFKTRQREFETDHDGYAHTKQLINNAINDLGTDWTCDLFFAGERDYWQRRNKAARVQKGRQDLLGLGWGNHDHHTYRSSRVGFDNLIQILELLGFYCRERFYADEQAGWGAQVLEHSTCGIVVFADVDLSPEEVAGDFAHNGLEDQDELGTVGLWCQLHGEAILQAGLHHLECTFDFDAARKQLAEEGVMCMAPFTDYTYLRQAFTAGEVWQVDRQRVEQAVSKYQISLDEAEKFINEGSIGSHLEILERNDGFKGFNQEGVSESISKIDPRTVDVAE